MLRVANREDSAYLSRQAIPAQLSRQDELALARELDARRTELCEAEAAGASEEVARLLRRKVERARAKLAQHGLRLVVRLAKRYAGLGVPLPDLVQEGNIGLLHAIEAFDHTRGYRLGTYAAWWIRQALHQAISRQSHTVRVPRHIRERRRAIDRFCRDFVQQNGREPTPHETANALELPLSHVREAQAAYWNDLSLDTPLVDYDSLVLSDTLADDEALTPAALLLERDLGRSADTVLATLSNLERGVVRMRFGLAAPGERSAEEVAKELHVSAERVRQIEARALRKLQNARRSRSLRSFLR